METTKKITNSLTFKGIIVIAIALLLLIPSTMIENLIEEREKRSNETILKINEKWSLAQTIAAPLVVVPYTTTLPDKDKKSYTKEHKLYVTPKDLKITAKLQPEERHFGIYKAILYKSDIDFSGDFSSLADIKIDNSVLHFDKAYIAVGVTDLRGITQNIDFKINNSPIEAQIGENSFFDTEEVINDKIAGKTLTIPLKDVKIDGFQFTCNLQLNGSSSIKFIPIGQTTNVQISGGWQSPSFTGAFTPEYTLENKQFSAIWNVLSFNRNIPENWTDDNVNSLSNNAFGVNLIEVVDNYQQNMRSAKYALMFILLTFVVFFFVEIFTKKPIHFWQYLLVGLALILFYSLLLSISEQFGFGLAYLIASAATITLISIYTYSILKKCVPSAILAGVLIGLYLFLYVILQLEDLALLIGSLFLFIILGVIMFVSNKIKRIKNEIV
jgi:inner membrane protein